MIGMSLGASRASDAFSDDQSELRYGAESRTWTASIFLLFLDPWPFITNVLHRISSAYKT